MGLLDNDLFTEGLRGIDSKAERITYFKVKEYLLESYEIYRNKVRDFFLNETSKIAIAMDGWTDASGQHFLGIISTKMFRFSRSFHLQKGNALFTNKPCVLIKFRRKVYGKFDHI